MESISFEHTVECNTFNIVRRTQAYLKFGVKLSEQTKEVFDSLRFERV